MANPQYNPNLGMPAAPPGAPQQVNWGSSVMPQQNAWMGAAVPPPPDVAAANQAAAALAAQQGIAAQKQDEALDALSRRYELAPKQAAIDKQLKTADAIRNMGSNLNTGSTNGGAPNWAGAIANVVGAYQGKKQQDAAQADAAKLGTSYRDIARLYFGAAPEGSSVT